jgi:hypothetical protein
MRTEINDAVTGVTQTAAQYAVTRVVGIGSTPPEYAFERSLWLVARAGGCRRFRGQANEFLWRR